MFVVTVSFRIALQSVNAFLSAVRANAAASLTLEPGCHRFDVGTAADGSAEVFLYELYTDAAAFAVHKTMAHFKAFDSATAPMVIDKQVRTYLLDVAPEGSSP